MDFLFYGCKNISSERNYSYNYYNPSWASNFFHNTKDYIIRINEAEANIEATLNKRFDLLNKSNDIIKSKIETNKEELLKTIANIRSQKLNNFELDKKLYKAIEEFHEYAEENIGLKEDLEYSGIEMDLVESESEIVSLKKYYNDIVLKYNELVVKPLYKTIANIKHYNIKESFDIEDHLDLINSLK